jgi:hypothetical protein
VAQLVSNSVVKKIGMNIFCKKNFHSRSVYNVIGSPQGILMDCYWISVFLICFLLKNQPHLFSDNFLSQRLRSIEEKISNLERQKAIAKDQIDRAHHEEMKYEVQSQSNIVTYEWHTMTDELKKAEEFEQIAKTEEKNLEEIERQIAELIKEKEALERDK